MESLRLIEHLIIFAFYVLIVISGWTSVKLGRKTLNKILLSLFSIYYIIFLVWIIYFFSRSVAFNRKDCYFIIQSVLYFIITILIVKKHRGKGKYFDDKSTDDKIQ